jgi:hypothetical protein
MIADAQGVRGRPSPPRTDGEWNQRPSRRQKQLPSLFATDEVDERSGLPTAATLSFSLRRMRRRSNGAMSSLFASRARSFGASSSYSRRIVELIAFSSLGVAESGGLWNVDVVHAGDRGACCDV